MGFHRQRFMLIGLFMLGEHGLGLASTTGSYYCPRSRVFLMQQSPRLEEEGVISAIGGGIKEPYVRKGDGNGGALWFETKSCSTKEYECLEFQQQQTLKPEKSFQLAVPKIITGAGTYTFRELVIVIESANIPSAGATDLKHQAMQVTVWQNIDGAEKPMTLTLEYRRGVTFLDGVDFWDGQFGLGETCSLVGNVGLFPNVVVNIRSMLKKSIQ